MKKCGGSRGARWSSASTRISRKARRSTTSSPRSRVPASPAREWLDGARRPSRDPWFNINVGDGFYHYHRSWNDDLSMPFAALPGYIRRVQAGESLERPVEKLQAERRQLIADYRELLRTDEERARLRPDDHARASRVPVCRGAQVLLRALVHESLLQQDPRVRRAAGAARLLRRRRGRVPAHALRARVRDRRSDDVLVDGLAAARAAALAGDRRRAPRGDRGSGPKHDTPPALGPVPDIIDDPAIVMLWGITRESLDTWLAAGRRRRHQRDPRLRRIAVAWSKGRRVVRQVGRGDLAAQARATSSSARSPTRPGRRSSRRSPARCPTSAAR